MADQQIVTASDTALQFDTLKPVCCDVMKSPSIDTLSIFNQMLARLPPKSVSPEILNYIIFPFVVHLKAMNRLKTDVKVLLLKTLAKILNLSGIDSFQCFFEIFQTYSIVLGTKNNIPTTDFNDSLPEEIVYSIEDGMARLLQNSLISHCEMVYDVKRVQAVGHCIFIQLQIITSNHPLETRIRAIDIVESLFTICAGNEEMSGRIFNFLPGVVIALRKASSSRVGRARKSLIVKSVVLLSKCVTISIRFKSGDDLKLVDQNLSVLLRSLSDELISNDDQDLRKVILNLSTDIIVVSENKMPKCEEILWTNILVGCCDEIDMLSSRSRLFLQENLYKTQLCDFENMMDNLKKSYTQFINNNLGDSITSLKYVAACLYVKKLTFVELNSFLPAFSNLLTRAVLKHQLDIDKEVDVTFFKPNPFLKVCEDVCKSLKNAANFDDLCEEIVPFLTFNSTLPFSERLENGCVGVLFLFIKILSSFIADDPKQADTQSYDIQNCDLTNMSSLFLEFLELQLSDKIQANPKTVKDLECEAVLLIEGLGYQACLDSQCVLPMVLYYLLEHAGDQESTLISSIATNSLCLISNMNSVQVNVKSQKSVLQELLTQNLDLIMSELSVRIRSMSSHPKCPNALIFLASYFDFSQAEFVSLIEQGFAQSCDAFYTTSQKSFTKLFYAFIYSLWNQRKDMLNSQGKNVAVKNLGNSNLCTKLLNYQTSLGFEVQSNLNCDLQNLDDIRENVKSENEIENAGSSVEDSLTPELKLVLKICRSVLNFIASHDDRTVQLTAMDCLIMGVQLLRDVDNSLLPLVHTIWSSLANRFTETDLVVVRKSFELLLAICATSGSFLKKRIVEQVFPKLTALLTSLARESERVDQRHVLYYTYTQAYKLQVIILEGLAELSLSMELNEEELDQIVSVCLLYVKPQQHKNLMEAALKVIDVFSNSKYASVIWMKIIAHGIRQAPLETSHPEYTPCPQFQI